MGEGGLYFRRECLVGVFLLVKLCGLDEVFNPVSYVHYVRFIFLECVREGGQGRGLSLAGGLQAIGCVIFRLYRIYI